MGVGEGHAAWEVQAYYTSPSEAAVAEQRLRTLREGHLTRVPAILDYASGAIQWGRAARRALSGARALDEVVEDVRVAASWAVAGGPLPGDGAEPDLPRLAARLETLRVGLVEEMESLRGLRPRLSGAVERILGEAAPLHGGPFAEGGEDGQRLLVALDGREASAGRWSSALEVARKARA